MENIGKYQITGELGSGGFGRVYKALDPTVGRVVAIKVLNVQDDPALIMRFEAEAKTSANLQHKNIVIVHEFGEQIIDQRHKKQFLVMEYLSGKNLQEIIHDKTPIAPLDKLLIMSEVAQGLQFAHEHGVVHRDVKPANIMRLSDGSVKIMDFGIARLMRGVNTRLTQAGIMIGTPQYMAPEQFTTDTADEKCDVWAYGVVFYEFLAGVNPFHGENAPQMIFRVTAEDPPPISTRLPNLPRSLDAILKRLLAKSRDDRYSNLEDVRFDLEPVILELRRAQVEDDLSRAAALIAEERLDEALTVVRRILESDQTNAQAREWRRKLPEQIRLQSLQMRIKALVEQADADSARKDYPAALEKLAEAVRLDRSNQKVRTRLDEILAEQERVTRAASLVSEARAEYQKNALTVAIDYAKEAARADPTNPEATGLVEEIGNEIQRRDAELQRRAGLGKAKGMLLVQSYESAVSVLQELAARFPEDLEVGDKLDEAKRLQADYAAQQRTDSAILESRELIRRGSYQRAIDALEALAKNIPQKGQVADLLTYAREQLDAERRAAEVENLLRQASDAPAGDFDLAISLVDRALDLDPGNEKGLRLRKSLLLARQADQEDRAIRRSVQDGRALLLNGRLDEAAAIGADLKSKHADHPVVMGFDREIERLIRERREKREREFQERVRQVEQLLDQGQAGDATKILSTLTVQFPNERALAPLMARATATEQDQKKREAINATLTRARDLATGRRWDQALAELERGLVTWPGTPELLQEQGRIAQLKVTQEAFDNIQQRIARHELEAAIAAADSVLAKFPGEARIVELREQSRRQLEFERLLKEAERLVFQGEVDQATTVVDELLRRAPGDVNVQRLKQTILRKQKRRQDFDAADQLCKRRKFQEAHDLVIRILLEDPEDDAAGDLLKRIEREAFEYERQQRIEQARAEASEYSKHRQYGAAVEVLEQIAGEYPDEEELLDDLQRAHEAMAQFGRKEAIARGRAELDALMKQQLFEDAIEKARELAADFPEEPFQQDVQAAISARDLRDRRNAQLARKEAIARGRAELDALMKQQLFEAAIEKARQLAANFPEEPFQQDVQAASAARELRDRRKAQFERKEAVARGRAELDALMNQQLFEDAIEKARQLAASFPEEPFQQDVQAAASARELRDRRKAQLERKEAIGRGRAELDALMKQRRFEDTIDKARQLVASFPEEPFQQDLQAAISARDLRDRRTQVDAEIAELEKLFRQGDAAAVRKGAEKLLESYPEPRARELLGWAKKTEQNLRSIKKKADGPRYDWRWIAAVVALPIVLFAAWKLIPKPPPVVIGELHVTPTELLFSYRPGDAVVPAKFLQLTGQPAGTVWVVKTSDKWFTATPIEPIGDGPITVQVDPRKLPPGDYTGVVTITAKNVKVEPVNVYVRLKISPIPIVPQVPQTTQLRLQPDPLPFTYRRNGPVPSDQSLQLTGDASGEALVVKVSKSPWLQATPRELSGDGPISVHVDPERLDVGEHTGVVTVLAKRSGASVTPATAEIHITVLPAEITPGPKPELNVQPKTLTFQYRRGASAPAAQSLLVTVKPIGESWVASTNDQWIKMNPSERAGDGSISVTVDPQVLALGDHTGTVLVSSKRNLIAPVTARITLTIQEAPPPPPVDCKALNYPGLTNDVVQWTGTLVPGQSVTLDKNNNAVVNNPPAPNQFKVTGGAIPGCEVTVKPLTPGISITEPIAANGFGKVTITNNSPQPVPNPKIRWVVK